MTTPRIRAGDTDRQSAVDRLAQHYTDGRLDTQEYDRRVEAAYAATFVDELGPLFADLPASSWHGSGDAGARRPWSSDTEGSRPGPGRFTGRPLGRRPHPAFIALMVLAVFGVIGAVGAITHGFFPFPLLVIALVFLAVRGKHGRGAWGPCAWGRQR